MRNSVFIFSLICMVFCLFSNAEKSNNPEASDLIKSTIEKGKLALQSEDFEEALNIYNDLLSLAKLQKEEKTVAAAYFNIGMIYYRLADYDLSTENYLLALEIYEENDNEPNIANTLNNLGMLYNKISKYELALEHYEKSLEINQRIDNQKNASNVYNNMGIIYQGQKKYQEALDCYNKCLEIKERLEDEKGIANTLNNIGLVYKYQEKYYIAIQHYYDALQINEKTNQTGSLINNLLNLGNAYALLGSNDSAKYYLNMGFDKAIEINSASHLINFYYSYYNFYLSLNDHENALSNYEKFNELQDSVFSHESNSRIAKMQLQFEYEKKQKEMRLMEQKNELQAKDQKLLLYILIGAGIILIFLLVIFYQVYRRIKEKHKLSSLKLQNKEHENKMLTIDKEKFAQELALKNRELTTSAIHLAQNNEIFAEIRDKLSKIETPSDPQAIKSCIRAIDHNLMIDNNWDSFIRHFEAVHPSFTKVLKEKHPDLTSKEMKHCTLSRINLSTKEIASIFNITVAGVQRSRVRIRAKMGIPSELDFNTYLSNIE